MTDANDGGNARPRRLGGLARIRSARNRAARSNDTIGRNGVLSLVALLALGGTRVVYGSMISRVTDHETYGVIGVLTAVTMIASFAFPAGVGAAMSRFVPFSRGRGDPALARGFDRLLQRIGLVSATVLGVAASVGVSLILDRPTYEAIEVGLLAFAYSVYTIEKAALYGFARVERYVGLEITAAVVTLVLTFIVVQTRSQLYLSPFIVGYTVFVAGARSTLRVDRIGPISPLAPDDRREVLGFVVLACAGTLASAGFLQGTQLLVAGVADHKEVAYFAAAVTLVAPMYFLPRALALALFPFMSWAHGAGETEVVRRHADLATRALLALLAPFFVLVELLSAEIMALFGGEAYVPGAPVLRIMMAAAYAAVIQVAAVNALSSGTGWQLRIPVVWSLTGCAIGLALVAVTGGPLGATGVALSYLVGTVITAGGPIAVVWRRYRMGWGLPLIKGGVTVGVAVVLASILASPDTAMSDGWLSHIVAAMLGFAATLVILRSDIVAVVRSSSAAMPAGAAKIEPA